MEGCEFFISGSNAILCNQAIPKVAIPKVAILKIRWATMNSVFWRCVGITKAKDASLRVVLKENPKPPLKLAEASSSSSSSSSKMPMNTKERDGSSAPKVTMRERDGSLAGEDGADHGAPNAAPGPMQWTSQHNSSYAQGCDDVDEQLGTKIFEGKLCDAKNNVRMNYCHAWMSLFGMSHDVKERFKKLTAEVFRRFGFNWKVTTWGFLSKACQEIKRSFEHCKVARRAGFFCVVDRRTRGDIYRNRMFGNGVTLETMQEWDKKFLKREATPLPLYTHPYEVRKRKYARWESRTSQIGRSDTPPHAWNYKKASQDDDERPNDPHEDDTALDDWSGPVFMMGDLR